MKHLFTTTALLFSMTAFAQVGINNTSPKATLDITAKTTDGSKPEGLIIPQLTGDKIRIATTATPTPVYGTAQKGLIVYASTADSAPAGATASITAPGYYYFDGSAWQKIATGNTLSTSLASGNILVGSASNVATAVSPIGDVAISNTGATSIGAGKVTNGHLASAAALTVKGNATNAAASPTDIAAGTDGYVLRRSGTSLGFGTVATAGIADGAVTANKMTLSNGKIYVGNSSNAAGEVSLSGDATMDNTGAASIVEGKGGIYKGNGALSKNTVVDQGTNTLAFTSTATTGTSHFTVDGSTLNVDAVNSRLGIGTNAPKATLDIAATSNGSKPEGLIAPRLSGDQLQMYTYASEQTGAIVYVNAIPTGTGSQTGNITSTGYYYFDGSLWQKISFGNNVQIKGFNILLPPSNVADFVNHSNTGYDKDNWWVISKATTVPTTNQPARMMVTYEYQGVPFDVVNTSTILNVGNNLGFPDNFSANFVSLLNNGTGGKTRLIISFVRVDNLINGWSGTFFVNLLMSFRN